MTSENRAGLTHSFIAGSTIVAVIFIMADCSKDVAVVDGKAEVACLQGGGDWLPNDTLNHVGKCLKRTVRK